MLVHDDPRTAGLKLIRTATEATLLALEAGAPVGDIRGHLLPVGLGYLMPGPGEPDTPSLAFIRAKLTEAVERTMAEFHTRPAGA